MSKENKTRFSLFSIPELMDLKNGLGWAYSEGSGGDFYAELTNEILRELENKGEIIKSWEWR